jgi:hypothetical protein
MSEFPFLTVSNLSPLPPSRGEEERLKAAHDERLTRVDLSPNCSEENSNRVG